MAQFDDNCLLFKKQRECADALVGIATVMVANGTYLCLFVICQVVFQDHKNAWRS
jgi:hypothetical protein